MARKNGKTSGAVEKKLVGVADVVITAAQRRKDPTLAIPVRSLSNVTFNERKGLSPLAHLDQALALVEGDVRQGADRDRQGGILAPLGRGDHHVGHPDEFLLDRACPSLPSSHGAS